MHLDFGERIDRTLQETEKSPGVDLSAIDWERCDSILHLDTSVGPRKLIGKLDFIERFNHRIALSHRGQRK
jgi:hypothetical protein